MQECCLTFSGWRLRTYGMVVFYDVARLHTDY
ncbi:hypothetical protein BN439_1516 [Erwinia amylovora Ea644]|nr:hypothetical protein BN439_1516 [Erwinia amylovora Ea644]CCP06597.1 hypothetical protein BN440_1565 [Erwinia amylovora MR1]